MQQAVFREVARDLLMFPVWWYSRGLMLMLSWCGNTWHSYEKYFGLKIWITNLFVPMFGQRDWQSRIISVFMRFVQIVGRLMALCVVTVGIVLILAAYAVAPVIVGLIAVYHVLGSILYVT